ncbi:MAG: DUF488 family protein [Desulfobacter sp.]
MAVSIVRLGSARIKDEGLRIGTVRRPPRGVPKAEFTRRNYYDVWLPNVAPSPETMKLGRAAKTEKEWKVFEKKYRAELARPENLRIVELLAVVSGQTDFSVGCYCENEARCHRSILGQILAENGAVVWDRVPW